MRYSSVLETSYKTRQALQAFAQVVARITPALSAALLQQILFEPPRRTRPEGYARKRRQGARTKRRRS